MQCIKTKFLPATNAKPRRIKAECERGSITISYPDADRMEECHSIAAQALVDKFIAEDTKRYGDADASSWRGKFHQGCFKNEFYHVFEED
jgi:hypothetical protein